MKKLVLKKENGEISILNVDVDVIRKMTQGCHLCSECKNAYATRCSKVADVRKKKITEYPYIVEGCQVYNDNNELEQFVVHECSNYVEEKLPRAVSDGGLTNSELEAKRAYLMEGIKSEYFDTETVEEANAVQKHLFNRGMLERYNPNIRVHK